MKEEEVSTTEKKVQSAYKVKKGFYNRLKKEYDEMLVPETYFNVLKNNYGMSQEYMRFFTYLIKQGCHNKKMYIPAADIKAVLDLPYDGIKTTPYLSDFRWKNPNILISFIYYKFIKATPTSKAVAESAQCYVSLTEKQLNDILVPFYDENDITVKLSPDKTIAPVKSRKTTNKTAPKPIYECKHVESLLDYMNNSRRVKQALNKLEKENKVVIPAEDRLYHAVHNSDRLYTNGKLFKRDIRKKVFNNTYCCDISACQLTVIAYLFNLPKLKKTLNNTNIWDYFTEFLHVENNSDNKQKIKDTIYAIIYGMGETPIRYYHEFGHILLQNELIIEILDYRNKLLSKIENGYILTSAFMEKLDLSSSDRPDKDKSKSVLAHYIQSYETYIINDIFVNFIENHKYIVLIGILHDAIYFTVSDIRSKNRYSEIIEEKMVNSALKFGIRLKVDCEKLTTI